MDLSFFDFEIFELDSTYENKISGPESADLVLILDEEDFEEHKDLIINIMNAINYDLDRNIQLCLLRQAQNIVLARHIHQPGKRVIVFGINPKRISMNASFKANHFYQTETFEIMLSHSLAALNENLNYKKALWAVLQEKFITNAK